MTPPPGALNLSEHQKRVLLKIARLMSDGATIRLELDLNQGGVRDFRGANKWEPKELEPSEALFGS